MQDSPIKTSAVAASELPLLAAVMTTLVATVVGMQLVTIYPPRMNLSCSASQRISRGGLRVNGIGAGRSYDIDDDVDDSGEEKEDEHLRLKMKSVVQQLAK